MRDDLLPTTASTLALLRRAMTFHRATAAPGGEQGRGPRQETAGRRTSAPVDPDGSRSLTERHLQVLGVGAPPDRTETGLRDFRW